MSGVVLLLHQLRMPPALFILASASGGGFVFFGAYVLLGGTEVLTFLKHLRRGLHNKIRSEPHLN